MKNIIRIEEAAMFALAIFLFYFQLDYVWWIFWVLLLAPDLSMLGYVINTKTGALLYNVFHHKALAVIMYVLGLFANESVLILTGLILFGHASMDRIFGYGLKYPDDFKHTHLGWM